MVLPVAALVAPAAEFAGPLSERAGARAACLATRDGSDECIGCMEWVGSLRNLANVLLDSRNFFGKSADHFSIGIVCAERSQIGSRR